MLLEMLNVHWLEVVDGISEISFFNVAHNFVLSQEYLITVRGLTSPSGVSM